MLTKCGISLTKLLNLTTIKAAPGEAGAHCRAQCLGGCRVHWNSQITKGSQMKETIHKPLGWLLGLSVSLAASSSAWSAENLEQVMERRGLTQKDLLAAAKTYTPTGGRDEYLAFSSGGQSGQMIVYGIPSMRILGAAAQPLPSQQ